MSTTRTPRSGSDSDADAPADDDPEERYECEQCEGLRDPTDSVLGSFCSWDCVYRHRGEKVLGLIRSDHTICSTCYGVMKDIMPVPHDAPECADGYQYPTEYAYIGAQDEARHTDHHGQQHSAVITRWGCDCGNVDPGDTHDVIQEANLKDILTNCVQALYYLHEKGAIPFAPTRSEYFDGLRKHWRDDAYAIGRAVYADHLEDT